MVNVFRRVLSHSFFDEIILKFDDDRIKVDIDKKWLKSFRFSPEAKELRKENPTLKIRVIKREYQYTDNKNKDHCENLIYFTNLSSESFTTAEIMEIYSRRWDIEVSYKTMKTTQEVERHISSDGDVARNDIYAKVLFYNIAGCYKKGNESGIKE